MPAAIIQAVEDERQIPLNPRQEKLVLLLVDIEAGTLSLVDALKQAGCPHSIAEQRSATLNRIRDFGDSARSAKGRLH